jgi:hypothetical protein
MTDVGTSMDIQTHITRIDRRQEEIRKFAAECRKLTAETMKLGHGDALSGWQLFLIGMAAGAALASATAGLLKLAGH